MSGPVETHESALTHAFADVLQAEDDIRLAKVELTEATNSLKLRIATAETAMAEAWRVIAELMRESGEYELTLPGSANDYRITWSTPRQTVNAEEDAVPDEFVKIERIPKLKEIGDHLKGLVGRGEPLPNWARFETGVPKLGWKAVKK